MIKLTLEEYNALPHPERSLLRRLAFGAPRPACFSPIHDLEHLRTILVQENERTGEFAGKWTDEKEDIAETMAQLVPDTFDVISGQA